MKDLIEGAVSWNKIGKHPKEAYRFVIDRAVMCRESARLAVDIRLNFVIPFESGIVVIKHWKIHNYIQKDRYKPTMYQEEKSKLESLTGELASLRTASLYDSAISLEKVRLAVMKSGDMDVATARKACDKLKDAHPDLVTVIAVSADGKLNFVCTCGKDAVASGAHAGNIVKKMGELTGGNGGGRPDSAVAGGRDASKLEAALAELEGFVRSLLK